MCSKLLQENSTSSSRRLSIPVTSLLRLTLWYGLAWTDTCYALAGPRDKTTDKILEGARQDSLKYRGCCSIWYTISGRKI